MDSFCLDQGFIQSSFCCFLVIIDIGLLFNPFRMGRNPSYKLLHVDDDEGILALSGSAATKDVAGYSLVGTQ